MKNINLIIKDVPAVVGVAARHIQTGKNYYNKADDIFFTASTLKIPLIFELYRQVDKGIINPMQRISVNDKSPGSGVLKDLSIGINPTIYDLATLMIIISDNTATDIIYKIIGKDNLHKTLLDLNLKSTHLPMTCKELLYSLYGVNTKDINEAIEIVKDKLSKGDVVLESDALSEDKSDVSSPNDMINLMEIIYKKELLTKKSSDIILDIMYRQQAKTIIQYFLPSNIKTFHKTGGVTSVRCDVGIVNGKSGPYSIAIMAKDVKDDKNIDLSLARISEAVYHFFN